MARNAGLDAEIVRRLPGEWPVSAERVGDALYHAGMGPGEELLRVAALLWKYRPEYMRRR